LRSH